MRGRYTTLARYVARALIAALALSLTMPTLPAEAVSVGSPSVSLSDNAAGVAGVTYTFAGYTLANNEVCSGLVVTFPVNTDVSGATLVGLGGSATVSGQTVTLAFSPSLPKASAISVSITGITNPTSAGTYNTGDIIFNLTNPGGNKPQSQPHPSADYLIAGSLLSLTINTPDPGQSVNFGGVDPGVTSGIKLVTVAVSSSVGYTIARSITGSVAALGLDVSGPATGAKTVGAGPFTDSYTLAPPWTTDPGDYTATVMYTVTQ